MAKLYLILLAALLIQVSLFCSVLVRIPIGKQSDYAPYRILEENKADFRAVGATREFSDYVWSETIKVFPAANHLKIPKVYFTDRPAKEFGYSSEETVYGFYDNSENVIVIFPKSHIVWLGADLSLKRNNPAEILGSMGREDARALIGITLIHEFRHYIFCSFKSVRSTRQHLDMTADEDMFRLMRKVSGGLSAHTDLFIGKEKELLRVSAAKDIEKEFEEYVKSGQH